MIKCINTLDSYRGDCVMKNVKKLCGIGALVLSLAGSGYYAYKTYEPPEERKFLIKYSLEEGVYQYPNGTFVYEKHEHTYRVLPNGVQPQPQQQQPQSQETPQEQPPLTQKERRELPKQVSIDDFTQENTRETY